MISISESELEPDCDLDLEDIDDLDIEEYEDCDSESEILLVANFTGFHYPIQVTYCISP